MLLFSFPFSISHPNTLPLSLPSPRAIPKKAPHSIVSIVSIIPDTPRKDKRRSKKESIFAPWRQS